MAQPVKPGRGSFCKKAIYMIDAVEMQNRSTEGCSKLKRSVDMTSSGKNGLNMLDSHV